MKSLVMNSARYLRLLRERPANAIMADIIITEIDKARLRSLIDLEQGRIFFELEQQRSSEPSSSLHRKSPRMSSR